MSDIQHRRDNMTDEQMMDAIASLPAPDMITASQITDPPGACEYYSARPVAQLLCERCRLGMERAAESPVPPNQATFRNS